MSDIGVIRGFVATQDAARDGLFIATVSAETDIETGKMFDIFILDSHHQGISITLNEDGTWSAVACGG